jgi:translocation and assembly module TamB
MGRLMVSTLRARAKIIGKAKAMGMPMTMKQMKIKPKLFKRILRIFLIVIFCFLGLLVVALLLIQTGPVQNFIKNKAVSYLQSKIHSKVEIGRVEVGFPKSIIVRNVFFEDQKKDTFFSSGILSIDLDMWKLLHGRVEIKDLHLEQATVKIKRVLPDTVFNFQFILDAFSSTGKVKPENTQSSSSLFSIEKIELDKIRLVFDDRQAGTDLGLYLSHLDLNISKMDPKSQNFGIPVFNISGLRGRLRQHRPRGQMQDEQSNASLLQLAFRKISLRDISFDYGNEISAFYFQLGLENLDLKTARLDWPAKKIGVDELLLSKVLANFHLARMSQRKGKPGYPLPSQPSDSGNWHIVVKKLELDSNNIAFNDDNAPLQSRGVDYSHFGVTGLSFRAKDTQYSQDSLAANISKAEFAEKSGFRLQAFKGNLLYSGNQTFIRNLELKTPGSLVLSSASIHYSSIETLKKNPGALNLDLDLRNSRVQVKDVLSFLPLLSSDPAFSDSNAVFLMNAKLKGKISDLDIDHLQLTGLKDTHIWISGHIKGIPSWKTVNTDLVIGIFGSSRRDLLAMVPSKSLPATVFIPEKWSLSGTLKGGLADLQTDLKLNTSDGNLHIRGGFRNLNDPKNLAYDATLSTEALNLGAILGDSTGPRNISLQIKAAGKGTDPDSADARFKGMIRSLTYRQYDYQNAEFKISVKDKLLSADIDIRDPNLNLSVTGSANWSSKYPAFKLKATIDSIHTGPLHFTKDNIAYQGILDADFPQTDPDQL